MNWLLGTIFWLYKKHIAVRTITFTLTIKLNKLILVGGMQLLMTQLLAESGFASNATSYINLPHHHFAPLKLEELVVYYWMACKAAWRYFEFIWISIHRQKTSTADSENRKMCSKPRRMSFSIGRRLELCTAIRWGSY